MTMNLHERGLRDVARSAHDALTALGPEPGRPFVFSADRNGGRILTYYARSLALLEDLISALEGGDFTDPELQSMPHTAAFETRQ